MTNDDIITNDNAEALAQEQYEAEEKLRQEAEINEKANAYVRSALGLKVALTTKDKVLQAISSYDNSENVNTFFVNGNAMWVSSDLRIKLANVISIEKAKGSTEFSEWYNGIEFKFSVDMWEYLLKEVEHYAYQCLCVTEQHKANVSAMDNEEDILAYDYKSGYPEKLQFNV